VPDLNDEIINYSTGDLQHCINNISLEEKEVDIEPIVYLHHQIKRGNAPM
jgi:hypothetical protein